MTNSTLNRQPDNQRSISFKATYLRVLTSSPPDKTDWWAAKELIDTGYATGSYHIDKSVSGYGEIASLVRFAPTVSGRLFADELADQIKRQTWRYRFTKASLAIGGFAGGWLVTLLSDGGKAFVLKVLGL